MDGDTDVDIEIDIQKEYTMARGEGKKNLECKIAEILWVAEQMQLCDMATNATDGFVSTAATYGSLRADGL